MKKKECIIISDVLQFCKTLCACACECVSILLIHTALAQNSLTYLLSYAVYALMVINVHSLCYLCWCLSNVTQCSIALVHTSEYLDWCVCYSVLLRAMCSQRIYSMFFVERFQFIYSLFSQNVSSLHCQMSAACSLSPCILLQLRYPLPFPLTIASNTQLPASCIPCKKYVDLIHCRNASAVSILFHFFRIF